MASSSELGIVAFVRYLTLGEDRRIGNSRNSVLIPSAARVEFRIHERELYSYGTHFPLARFVPAKRGRRALWLINGDVWRGGGWSLTSRHQSETRSAIADVIADAAKSGRYIGNLIVPFSALDGATIDYDSIRPIHVRDDRREGFTNTASVPRHIVDMPIRARVYAEDPRRESINVSDTLAASLPLKVSQVSDVSGIVETLAHTAKLTRSVCYRGMSYGSAPEYAREYREYDPPEVTYWLDSRHEVTVIDNGAETVALQWHTDRHWLGDSLFTASRVSSHRVPCPNHVATLANSAWCETCGRQLDRDGFLTRETRKRSRFVSSFDYNEPRELYFLASLPRTSRARTVDMAIDDLAPRAVHAAYARGLAVKRQGDIFAIPTPLTTADVYAHAKRRTRLYVHTHASNPRPGEVGYNAPLSLARAQAWLNLRRATFLAEIRGNMARDTRPHTPEGWRKEKRIKLAKIADSIARHEERVAAFDGIGADGVPYYASYTAENAARGIISESANYVKELARSRERSRGYASTLPAFQRRGMCYSRAIAAWRNATDTAANRYRRPIDWQALRATLAIHGTAHTATEVIVCAGGVTYIRGVMRHVPAIIGETRASDHRRVALDGAAWYIAIRNTVPRQ